MRSRVRAANGAVLRRQRVAPSGAPSVTVGPTAVNNRDGTVTISWETSQPTTSVVSGGLVASDPSYLTSHALTVSASDGNYLFSVGGLTPGGAFVSSVTGICAVTSTLLSHFMIYPHINSLSGNNGARFFLSSNQDGSAFGQAAMLGKVATPSGGFIYAFYSLWEGAMFPGVAFPFTPDVTSGTVTTTTDVSNFRYKTVANAVDYFGWTVPAFVTAGNGMPSGQLDRLFVFSDGNFNFKVVRTRSGADTTIANNVTPAGDGRTPTAITLTGGNELIPGDTVKIFGQGALGASVGAVQAYASTGTFPNNVAHRIMNSTDQIQMTAGVSGVSGIWINGDSAEVAYQIAPTGSPLLFVGGAAHQGGGNGEETPHTEVWTIDGATGDPTQGYQRAKVALARSSTVKYDGANLNIATMDTTYTGYDYGLRVDGTLTYNVALDTGNLYVPMLPVQAYATMKNTFDGSSSESVAIGAVPKTWASTATHVIWASGGSVDTGVGVYGAAGAGSSVLDTFDHTNAKNYQRLAPLTATNAAAATVKRGTGIWFNLPAAGPVAPTIAATSCTIAADGRTIMVRPATTSGGITGSTGLTFKRSGSSITAGAAATNNADGTITYVLTLANKVLSTDTITVDVATASFYDAYGIMMVAAAGIATVNGSTQ